MSKILLVGNGFTSHLVPEYKNEPMMTKIKEHSPEIFRRANELFSPFRKKVNRVQHVSVAGGYSGTFFSGQPAPFRPITDLPYNTELLEYVKAQLLAQGFSESILEQHFQTFGLIYETQLDEISNVENLLKIIDLFSIVGCFSSDDKNTIELLANHVYFNNGDCGDWNISESIKANISNWLSAYDIIFTTNYDCLMDDILSTDQIRHLHGGFHYADKYSYSPTIVPPEKACLIWGISGEEKHHKMQGGFSFPTVYPLVSPISVFEKYLSELQKVQVTQIDIFGYSGENDQHINQAISQNTSIREIHYFCNPNRVYDSTEAFSVKSRFNIGTDKKLVLESWDTVWNQLFRER